MYSVLKLHMHIILGFPKCGSMSLNQYLINRYGKTNVGWSEAILYTIEDQMRLFKEGFGDPRNHDLYFITRDIEEMEKSRYNFWVEIGTYTYKQFYKNHEIQKIVIKKIPRDQGEPNPIPPWHLEELMEPWMKYNPTIYSLKEASKMKDFPKLNVTTTGYRRIK